MLLLIEHDVVMGTPDARKALADSILLGLPGTVDDLTPEQFREMLKAMGFNNIKIEFEE